MRGKTPDWTVVDDYRFTETLSPDQWAWEFLRRNPRYLQEWEEFIASWRVLEATYGKPAKRDIQAWKQDPRAWVPAAECADSDCRVDGDKVLIECAMGARWGFYKFPPDPGDADPVGQGRLVWREIHAQARLLEDPLACTEAASLQALVCFDLGLPLQEQILSAKRQLQIAQRRRVKAGVIPAPRIAAHRERLCRLLRLLDALAGGAARQAIEQQLYAGLAVSFAEEHKAALALRDRDYRQLSLLE